MAAGALTFGGVTPQIRGISNKGSFFITVISWKIIKGDKTRNGQVGNWIVFSNHVKLEDEILTSQCSHPTVVNRVQKRGSGERPFED